MEGDDDGDDGDGDGGGGGGGSMSVDSLVAAADAADASAAADAESGGGGGEGPSSMKRSTLSSASLDEDAKATLAADPELAGSVALRRNVSVNAATALSTMGGQS